MNSFTPSMASSDIFPPFSHPLLGLSWLSDLPFTITLSHISLRQQHDSSSGDLQHLQGSFLLKVMGLKSKVEGHFKALGDIFFLSSALVESNFDLQHLLFFISSTFCGLIKALSIKSESNLMNISVVWTAASWDPEHLHHKALLSNQEAIISESSDSIWAQRCSCMGTCWFKNLHTIFVVLVLI